MKSETALTVTLFFSIAYHGRISAKQTMIGERRQWLCENPPVGTVKGAEMINISKTESDPNGWR